jgi:hypothetical protein
MHTALNFYGIMAVDFASAVVHGLDLVPTGLAQDSVLIVPLAELRDHSDLGVHGGDFLSDALAAVEGQRRQISLRTSFACCGGGRSSRNSRGSAGG